MVAASPVAAIQKAVDAVPKDDDEDAPQLVELLRGDRVVEARLVTKRLDAIEFTPPAADLDPNATWSVRVTNTAKSTVDLAVGSATPAGGVPVRVPTEVVNGLLAKARKRFNPMLHLDSAGCSLTVTKLDGQPFIKEFDLPEFKFSLLGVTVRPKLSDINSTDVEVAVAEATARYPHGAIMARLKFEEEGREVKLNWLPDADLQRLEVTATLGLTIQDGTLTYEDVTTSCPLVVDLNNVPDVIVDKLFGYTKKVRQTLETRLNEKLEEDDLRAMIGDWILAGIKKHYPSVKQVIGIDVSNGIVTLTVTT
jgi:hypothetical protein